MVAPDEATAERLTEEYIGQPGDASTAAQQEEERFYISQIEMVDNHSFDAILVDEGPLRS